MDKMRPLEDMYKASFFSKRHKLAWRVPIVVDAIQRVFNPKTVYDFGCATGDYVGGLKRRGLQAVGFEGSKNCLPFLDKIAEVIILDLRKRTKFDFADLAMALEVAEHIEPEYADTFVWNLANNGKTILITAAGPGQKGHHHLNCQPSSYWIAKFAQEGCLYDARLTNAWKEQLEPYRKKREIRSYYHNALVFREAK